MNKINWRGTRLMLFVAVWLVVIVAAFYGFFWRYIQPFDHQQLYPDGQVDSVPFAAFIEKHVQLPDSRLDTVVLHWLDPSCFCSVYSGTTVDTLSRETSSQTTTHVIVTPPGKSADLVELLPVLQGAEIIALSQSAYELSKKYLPATPAALVYNKKAETVSYLGPHSSGVVCGSGTGFVELVLNNLQHGFDPLLYELEQSGCFCTW